MRVSSNGEPACRELGLRTKDHATARRRARAIEYRDDAALLKLLKDLSCRDYEACVEPAAESFGLTASSLSRRFKRASAKKGLVPLIVEV